MDKYAILDENNIVINIVNCTKQREGLIAVNKTYEEVTEINPNTGEEESKTIQKIVKIGDKWDGTEFVNEEEYEDD